MFRLSLAQLNRRQVFWAGLVLLAAFFVGGLILAYCQQVGAQTLVQLDFPEATQRQVNLRTIQIEISNQNAREPLFSGSVFVGVENTPIQSDELSLYRDHAGNYGTSEIRLTLSKVVSFGTTHVVSDVAALDFPTDDGGGQSRFPFDSSWLHLGLSLKPEVPIDAIRIANRVPGFVLVRSSVHAERKADGSFHVRLLLRRNFFTQLLCCLIVVAGLLFAILILGTQTVAALASSVAAFFFSLWSLRGVLVTQIQAFPTLLDYAILLLCSFMLIGLLWRVMTHPELLRGNSAAG